MNKPTDEELKLNLKLLRISVDAHDTAKLAGVRGLSLQVSGEHACYAHGWREAVEALREQWDRYQRDDLSQEEFEGFVAELVESHGVPLRTET